MSGLKKQVKLACLRAHVKHVQIAAQCWTADSFCHYRSLHPDRCVKARRRLHLHQLPHGRTKRCCSYSPAATLPAGCCRVAITACSFCWTLFTSCYGAASAIAGGAPPSLLWRSSRAAHHMHSRFVGSTQSVLSSLQPAPSRTLTAQALDAASCRAQHPAGWSSIQPAATCRHQWRANCNIRLLRSLQDIWIF